LRHRSVGRPRRGDGSSGMHTFHQTKKAPPSVVWGTKISIVLKAANRRQPERYKAVKTAKHMAVAGSPVRVITGRIPGGTLPTYHRRYTTRCLTDETRTVNACN
jgi:hypothetical protein